MKELITKNPDGTYTYDFHKFFTFDDAIMAEWKLNSPDLDKEVLSQLLERFIDKTGYCTDGRGRVKPQEWDTLVEMWAKQLTAVREKCYCEELLEQFLTTGDEEIRIGGGSSSRGPAITMSIHKDYGTNKRLYFYIGAYEEGENSSDEYLKYCPFCGRKLTEITV